MGSKHFTLKDTKINDVIKVMEEKEVVIIKDKKQFETMLEWHFTQQINNWIKRELL